MNLKQLREKKGLTQEQIAKHCNIPLGTIRDWEQKGFPKQIIYFLKIQELLHFNFNDLSINEKDDN